MEIFLLLTDEQIIKVKRYLGYPALDNRKKLYAGVPMAVPTALLLENHVRSLDGTFSLIEAQDLLEEIACSRKLIGEAKKRLSVKEVAYAVKFRGSEISQLWEEDYKLCEQLADLLYIPIYKHPTGQGIYYDLKGGGGGQIGIRY